MRSIRACNIADTTQFQSLEPDIGAGVTLAVVALTVIALTVVASTIVAKVVPGEG